MWVDNQNLIRSFLKPKTKPKTLISVIKTGEQNR